MSHILWKNHLFATLFIRQILRHFEAKKAHFLGGLAGVSKMVVYATISFLVCCASLRLPQ